MAPRALAAIVLAACTSSPAPSATSLPSAAPVAASVDAPEGRDGAGAQQGSVRGQAWSYEEVDGQGRLRIGARSVIVERRGDCYRTQELFGCVDEPADIAEELIRFSPDYSHEPTLAPGSCPVHEEAAVPISRLGDQVFFPICEGERCDFTWARARELAPREGGPRAWILVRGARERGVFTPDCGNWGECQIGVALPCGAHHLTLVLPFDYRWTLEPDGVAGGLWAFREARRAGSADAEADGAELPAARWVWRAGKYVLQTS